MFISFYVGISCSIVFQLLGAFIHNNDRKDPFDHFDANFMIDHLSTSEKVVAMSYYSFTTLSTVGFGDLYPLSDGERLWVVIIMLGGVMCFSYIMGLFTEIMTTATLINDPIEHYQELDLFLKVMDRFNTKALKRSLREGIYDYFEYKWENDVN
tara:strand:- start:1272 stop:1733 length:462 start_codon:yes stop_codon:yes gene_type:complete